MTMKQRAHTLWEKAEALTTYVRGMGYDIDTAEHEAYTETLRHVADHGLDKTTRTFQQRRDTNPPRGRQRPHRRLRHRPPQSHRRTHPKGQDQWITSPTAPPVSGKRGSAA